MKKFFFNAMIAVMAVLLTGCAGSVKREKLIGSWSPVSIEAVIDGESQVLPADDTQMSITYNEDSTVVASAPLFGKKPVPVAEGTWSLDGKNLSTTYTKSIMGAIDDKTIVSKITELSDSVLICEATETVEGVTATTKTKYVRVVE